MPKSTEVAPAVVRATRKMSAEKRNNAAVEEVPRERKVSESREKLMNRER